MKNSCGIYPHSRGGKNALDSCLTFQKNSFHHLILQRKNTKTTMFSLLLSEYIKAIYYNFSQKKYFKCNARPKMVQNSCFLKKIISMSDSVCEHRPFIRHLPCDLYPLPKPLHHTSPSGSIGHPCFKGVFSGFQGYLKQAQNLCIDASVDQF